MPNSPQAGYHFTPPSCVVNLFKAQRYYVTFALCHRNSVCRLSVVSHLSVCDVRGTYSEGLTFRQ